MEKLEMYQDLCNQLEALLENETDTIANLANASALLAQTLEDINWVGFYLWKQIELVLGPFQGKVACMHIALGKGVCGTCAANQSIQRIANVHEFPGHIACDGASNSELVIPIYKDGIFFGVFDIDAPIYNRFDALDEQGLQTFLHLLEAHLS